MPADSFILLGTGLLPPSHDEQGGVVEVHGTGSNCRDELSDLQQGGGKIRLLRQCVELSWNHTGLSASNHISKLPFLSIYHYTTSYHPGTLLNSGATMIFP